MGKFINLKSVDNFQTLEGLENKEKRKIKKNILFRSAHLHNLNNKELQFLKSNLNIKTIIDFRSDTSFNKRPDKIDDSFNLFHIRPLEYLNNFVFELNMKEEPKPFLKDLYYRLALSDESINAYKKFFDILLNNDGAFLLHCTSGKDRTGIAIDLLLLALGFSIDDAKKEHLNVNIYQEKIMNEFFRNNEPKNEYEKEFYNLFYLAQEDFINYYFSIILEKYKSINNYLYQCFDLNEDKIKKLKDLFLE